MWRLDARTYTWTLLAAGDPKFAPRERHGAVILSGRGSLLFLLSNCVGCILSNLGGKVMVFCGRKLDAVDYANVVSFKVAVSPIS